MLGCLIVCDLSAAPLARRVTVMVVMVMPARGECHEAFSLLHASPNGVKLSRMKAIRVHQFGDPSVMKLEDVPDRPPALARCWSTSRPPA